MCQWPLQQPGWVKSCLHWRQWLLWIQGSGLENCSLFVAVGGKSKSCCCPSSSMWPVKKKKAGKAESLPDNTFTSMCNVTEESDHPAPFAGSPRKGSGDTWIMGVWADEQNWGVCTGRHWVQTVLALPGCKDAMHTSLSTTLCTHMGLIWLH